MGAGFLDSRSRRVTGSGGAPKERPKYGAPRPDRAHRSRNLTLPGSLTRKLPIHRAFRLLCQLCVSLTAGKEPTSADTCSHDEAPEFRVVVRNSGAEVRQRAQRETQEWRWREPHPKRFDLRRFTHAAGSASSVTVPEQPSAHSCSVHAAGRPWTCYGDRPSPHRRDRARAKPWRPSRLPATRLRGQASRRVVRPWASRPASR